MPLHITLPSRELHKSQSDSEQGLLPAVSYSISRSRHIKLLKNMSVSFQNFTKAVKSEKHASVLTSDLYQGVDT